MSGPGVAKMADDGPSTSRHTGTSPWSGHETLLRPVTLGSSCPVDNSMAFYGTETSRQNRRGLGMGMGLEFDAVGFSGFWLFGV